MGCAKAWYKHQSIYRFTNADIGFVLFFEWGTLPIWVREMEKENSKPTKDVDVW
jgi:hypothetical protein